MHCGRTSSRGRPCCERLPLDRDRPDPAAPAPARVRAVRAGARRPRGDASGRRDLDGRTRTARAGVPPLLVRDPARRRGAADLRRRAGLRPLLRAGARPVRTVAVDALLAAAVLSELVCVLGVLASASVYERLHYAGAPTAAAPTLVLAAGALRQPHPYTAPVWNALFVAVVL